jgi:hypothetical protein
MCYFGGHRLNLPETSFSETSAFVPDRLKPISGLGPSIIIKQNKQTFSGSIMEKLVAHD